MAWYLDFASKSRGMKPEGWKIEGLGHTWMGWDMRHSCMGIYYAIMPTVSMFRDFHNRKSTIGNEDYRQNFFHHGDGRGGVCACTVAGRLGGLSCFVWSDYSVWNGYIPWEVTVLIVTKVFNWLNGYQTSI